jgi:hypothetical protein
MAGSSPEGQRLLVVDDEWRVGVATVTGTAPPSAQSGGILLDATTPVRTPPMCWAALTTDKTIVTGEHPPETADALVLLRGLIEEGKLGSAINRRSLQG